MITGGGISTSPFAVGVDGDIHVVSETSEPRQALSKPDSDSCMLTKPAIEQPLQLQVEA